MENKQPAEEVKIGFSKSKFYIFLGIIQILAIFYFSIKSLQLLNTEYFSMRLLAVLCVCLIPSIVVFLTKKESIYSIATFFLLLCFIPLFIVFLILNW